MKIVVCQDPDKTKREIGQIFLDDFVVWHRDGKIGQSYQRLAEAVMELPSCRALMQSFRIGRDDVVDIARDAALDAWKHLADRHHSDPLHLYNEIPTCLAQRLVKRATKHKNMKTFGSHRELVALGFEDADDGEISNTTLQLDLRFKLKHDLADFRSALAVECLTNELLTIREIQEFAGFSNYQARELKSIMTNFVENYCGIS